MNLLLSSYYYPPSIGGVERQSHMLARGLVERGHRVRVISAQLPGCEQFQLLDGVHVERVSPGHGSRWQRMATYLAGMLAATVRARRWTDVVQVQQSLYPAAALAALAPALRRPLVVRNAGSGEFGGVQLMRRVPFGTIGLGLMARTSTGVSLNTEMTAEMRSAGFRRVVEIPNGVVIPPALTSERRAHARRRLQLRDQVVLYVGRLEAEKGVEVLLRGWPAVQAESATLLIVGDGPERAQLEHLVQELGCQDSVRFTGLSHEVSLYLQAADVFVLPSHSEGVANSLLEAMAQGLAVVATDIDGNRKVIESPSVGRLVSVGSPRAVAAAIHKLLVHPDQARRMGEAARDHVARYFSMVSMLDAYEQLYRKLMSDKTCL